MNRGKSGNKKMLSVTDVDVKIQEVQEEIGRIHNLSAAKSAKERIVRESQLSELNAKFRALTMGREIQRAIDSLEKEEDTQRLAKVFHPRMKNQGQRRVRIRETGGFLLVIWSTYWSRNCDRRKQGKGIYPALVRLGISDRCVQFRLKQNRNAGAGHGLSDNLMSSDFTCSSHYEERIGYPP